jgi:FkbM family methyltransferase
MKLPDSDRHFADYLQGGRYQGAHRDLALSFCERFRTAIDVGAHVGFWSVELQDEFETIHAFEPIPDNVVCLRQNVDLDRVVVWSTALGDRRASVRMELVKPDNSGTWAVSEKGTIKVEQVKLDDFGFDDVDLIKIDAESYELNILRGSIETIKRCRPIIVVELRDTKTMKEHGFPVRYDPREVFQFLDDLGMSELGWVSVDHVFGWKNLS